MNNDLLAAALRYAEHSWPVFPCERRGKRPRTKNGALDATTNPEQITNWWRANGAANVAIVTGAKSGVLVLDVDGDEGAESLRTLERAHSPLPRTASVVTPSGGAHYYFAWPSVDIRNSAGLLGTGLDIRGTGGYVLAPPSQGPNGRRYEPDERTALAELPVWLLSALRGPQTPRQATPATQWVELLTGINEGRRNSQLAALTGHLLRRYVDVDVTTAIVQLVNQHRCRPPLDTDEVERIIDSIAEREARRRGVAA